MSDEVGKKRLVKQSAKITGEIARKYIEGRIQEPTADKDKVCKYQHSPKETRPAQ